MTEDGVVEHAFLTHMRVAKRSERTIKSRMEILGRLQTHAHPTPLLSMTQDDLISFQATFAHLSPATVDIYTRHLQAFFKWAADFNYAKHDPAAKLARPRVRRGVPHPTGNDDLRIIFATATGSIRLAYVLATFAGLRCGEICRLQRQHLNLHGTPTAFVQGKGGKERIVPLLPSVVTEINRANIPRMGWVVSRRNGMPYTPNQLSVASHHFLHEIGVETTLHSSRHYFGTWAAKLTKDPLLIRDLMGHESVATTEGYLKTDLDSAHERLSGFSTLASDFLTTRLRAV